MVIGGEITGLYTALTAAQNVRDQEFIGPAAVLRAQRYIFDSRTTNANERLKVMQKLHGVWACKSYYICTVVCPKNIKVTGAILRTKKKIIQEQQLKVE